jgi:hypothetical protein
MRTRGKWWLGSGVLGLAFPLWGSLFKLDLGGLENIRIPVNEFGEEIGPPPEPLTDWTVIGTWAYFGLPDNRAIWPVRDFSADGDNDVTLTILDDRARAERLDPENPPYAVGMNSNNVSHPERPVVYDGIPIPLIVRDDYLWRDPDRPGTQIFFRFANLDPGEYDVTVFEGRTTDFEQYGKIWVDDASGGKEPSEQNTGNFAAWNADEEVALNGNPQTVTVRVRSGEYLWYAHMEDGTGGISGMIIRSRTSSVPVKLLASPTASGVFEVIPEAIVDGAARTITIPAPQSTTFYRVGGVSGAVSIDASGPDLVFRLP